MLVLAEVGIADSVVNLGGQFSCAGPGLVGDPPGELFFEAVGGLEGELLGIGDYPRVLELGFDAAHRRGQASIPVIAGVGPPFSRSASGECLVGDPAFFGSQAPPFPLPSAVRQGPWLVAGCPGFWRGSFAQVSGGLGLLGLVSGGLGRVDLGCLGLVTVRRASLGPVWLGSTAGRTFVAGPRQFQILQPGYWRLATAVVVVGRGRVASWQPF